jgi:hypothetical protein
MWQPELVLRHLSLLQERHFCFKFGDENKVVPVGFELEFLDIYPYLKIKMLPIGQDSSESCCVCLCVFNILSFSFFFCLHSSFSPNFILSICVLLLFLHSLVVWRSRTDLLLSLYRRFCEMVFARFFVRIRWFACIFLRFSDPDDN